jgi:hypothetical protein
MAPRPKAKAAVPPDARMVVAQLVTEYTIVDVAAPPMELIIVVVKAIFFLEVNLKSGRNLSTSS